MILILVPNTWTFNIMGNGKLPKTKCTPFFNLVYNTKQEVVQELVICVQVLKNEDDSTNTYYNDVFLLKENKSYKTFTKLKKILIPSIFPAFTIKSTFQTHIT